MYLVFAGSSYYPNGGWNDFKGYFDNLTDAYRYLATVRCDWWQIVRAHSHQIIEKWGQE